MYLSSSRETGVSEQFVATITASTTHSAAIQPRTGSCFWRWLIQSSLVALAFLLACNEISDYDIWWHLKTGQLIPQRGIPSTDWYSFTSSDRPWIDVHWGFQLIAATIHSLAGVPGLVILQACVIATTITIALTAYRRQWSVWPQFGVMLVALLVMSIRFYVRPEIFTLLFTSIFLTVLLHAEERPRLLWILPFVQVLWANVQSLFVFGPLLLGMYWAEVILRGRGYKGHVRLLAIVTGLVGVACIVSPYGIWNVMFLADVWQKMDPEAGKFYRATIGELKDVRSFLAEGGWQSGGIYILFLMMFLGAVGVVVRWREILLKREVFRLLPIIAFTWLALQAMRNASHFALVVGIISAWNLGPSFPRKTTEFRPAMVAVLLSLFVGIYFVGGRLSEWIGSHRRFGFGTHPEQFSFEAMRICSLPGMPDRAAIFHMGHAANYIYACGADRKVLMDPRLEVHTEQTLRDYRSLEGELETGTNGPQMLDRFGINLVVAGCEQNIQIQATLFSSPAWKCVHWDPIAAVFVRSTLKLPPGVEEFDFRRGMFDDAVAENADSNAGNELILQLMQVSMDVGVGRQWLDWCWDKISSIPANLHPYAGRDNPSQVEASRLFTLAQSLAGQQNPSQLLVRRIAWRSARRACGLRLENPKILGRSLAIIAMFDRLMDGETDSLYHAEFRRVVHHHLRLALEKNSEDLTSGFYLQQMLFDGGSLDECVRILKMVSAYSPANAAQRNTLPQLGRLYETRRESLVSARRNVPVQLASWDDLLKYRDLRLLGDLAVRLKSSNGDEVIRALNEDQRISVGRWYLQIDQLAHVQKVFGFSNQYELLEYLIAGRPMEPGISNEVLDRELFDLAWGLLTGKRLELRDRLEAINPDECTPAQRKILARFRDLLIDEPDKR